MSNGRTHRWVGAAAGGASALAFCEPDALVSETIAEVVGGVIGGLIAQACPDWLEPATSPRHRQRAHSMTVGVTLATYVSGQALVAQRWLRERADELDVEAAQAEAAGGSSFWKGLFALLLRVAAGLVAGALAGYVSHLVLDASTPAGLPII